MKCREKPESRLYIYTKQTTYPQLLQVIVNTHEHEEQYIFTHSFLEIGLQTLKAKGSPKVCQHLLKRLLRTLSSFSYLQGQRLHRPSGQPVLAFNHHYSKKGGVFLCLNRVPCICCCAYCLLTFHRAPRKIWLSLLPPIKYLYIFTRSPSLFPRINNPSSSQSPLVCQILNPLINFVGLHWITAYSCPSYGLLLSPST